MSFRRALRTTSAARSIRLRLVPCAIAATGPIEQGQITMPALGAEPEAGPAARALSAKTRTPLQPPPVALFRAGSACIPHPPGRGRPPPAGDVRPGGPLWV